MYKVYRKKGAHGIGIVQGLINCHVVYRCTAISWSLVLLLLMQKPKLDNCIYRPIMCQFLPDDNEQVAIRNS